MLFGKELSAGCINMVNDDLLQKDYQRNNT